MPKCVDNLMTSIDQKRLTLKTSADEMTLPILKTFLIAAEKAVAISLLITVARAKD